MSGLSVNDTFFNGVHEYLNINLDKNPINFTSTSGGGNGGGGVSIWMNGVFLTELDSYNQKGVVKINARIINSWTFEVNRAEAVFVKHNEHTLKFKNLFKNLNQLKDPPQKELYKKITLFFPMKNLVNKRFDDFKVIKPNFIEIKYEHNTETIICKDWCVDNE